MTAMQHADMAGPKSSHLGSGIRAWNVRQIRFLLRYGSLYHVPMTADTIAPLASRYAEKHAITRPRALHPAR